MSKKLAKAIRIDSVAQCMAYGIESPSDIADTLDEDVRTIARDVREIKEKLVPYFEDIDVDSVASEAVNTYKKTIKSAGRDVMQADTKIRELSKDYEDNWKEVNFWRKMKKDATSTLLRAQKELDNLYQLAGVYEQAKPEFTFVQESHCKDCPYLQRAYECPECREYHKQRIRNERNEIEANVTILEDNNGVDEEGD